MTGVINLLGGQATLEDKICCEGWSIWISIP